MEFINNFLNQYGYTLIYTILMSIISYLGYRVQTIYEKYIEQKIKKEQANMVCQAINQLYKNISNEEKLEKAIYNLKIIFEEKEIKVTDLEIRFLIESTVNCNKPDNLKNYIKEVSNDKNL